MRPSMLKRVLTWSCVMRLYAPHCRAWDRRYTRYWNTAFMSLARQSGVSPILPADNLGDKIPGMSELETNPPNSRNVTDIIRRRSDEFLSAIRGRDLNAIINLVASDAVILPPLRPAVSGTPEISEFVRALLDAGLSEVDVQQIEFQHAAGLVVEMGYYTLRLRRKNGHEEGDKGKYVTSWRCQADGEYRITSSIWSSEENLRLYGS